MAPPLDADNDAGAGRVLRSRRVSSPAVQRSPSPDNQNGQVAVRPPPNRNAPPPNMLHLENQAMPGILEASAPFEPTASPPLVPVLNEKLAVPNNKRFDVVPRFPDDFNFSPADAMIARSLRAQSIVGDPFTTFPSPAPFDRIEVLHHTVTKLLKPGCPTTIHLAETFDELKETRKRRYRSMVLCAEGYRNEYTYVSPVDPAFNRMVIEGVATHWDWEQTAGIREMRQLEGGLLQPAEEMKCSLTSCIARQATISFTDLPFISGFIRGREFETTINCMCGTKLHTICAYHLFFERLFALSSLTTGRQYEPCSVTSVLRSMGACITCGAEFSMAKRKQICAVFTMMFAGLGMYPECDVTYKYSFGHKARRMTYGTGPAPNVLTTNPLDHSFRKWRLTCRPVSPLLLRDLLGEEVMKVLGERFAAQRPTYIEVLRITVSVIAEYGSPNCLAHVLTALHGGFEEDACDAVVEERRNTVRRQLAHLPRRSARFRRHII